ncbi:MAG: hypothetical protein ACLR70_04985 [Streptococcus thermophilus]
MRLALKPGRETLNLAVLRETTAPAVLSLVFAVCRQILKKPLALNALLIKRL